MIPTGSPPPPGVDAPDTTTPPGPEGPRGVVYGRCYLMIFVTVPAPTVRPPSRIA